VVQGIGPEFKPQYCKRKKEGRKEGKKERKNEGRKEGKKEKEKGGGWWSGSRCRP
jgi:hypothetical protein